MTRFQVCTARLRHLAAGQTLNTIRFLPFLVKAKIFFEFFLVSENRYARLCRFLFAFVFLLLFDFFFCKSKVDNVNF